jgi:hypothetical protein
MGDIRWKQVSTKVLFIRSKNPVNTWCRAVGSAVQQAKAEMHGYLASIGALEEREYVRC